MHRISFIVLVIHNAGATLKNILSNLAFTVTQEMKGLVFACEAYNATTTLRGRIPSMSRYNKVAADFRNLLLPAYEEYTSIISSPSMAASLEASTFLYAFAELTGASRVADLGSGFSSYVFRLYASRSGSCECFSVDDQAEWLDKTRAFLEQHQLSTDNMFLWSDFSAMKYDSFDLVFYDLGTMSFRADNLPRVMELIESNGSIVLDDMNWYKYRNNVFPVLREHQMQHISLYPYTIDNIRRFSHLVTPAVPAGLQSGL